MAGPILAEQTCLTLLAFVNAGMAGRAGTEVASGVGLVNSVTAMVTALFSSVALGGTVAVSRARGAGKPEDATRAAFHCLVVSIGSAVALTAVLIIFSRFAVEALFGASPEAVRRSAEANLVWSAAGYPFLAATLAFSGVLRGAGDARTPMVVNILMNLVNAGAGRVFIFGAAIGFVRVPSLGAAGAGIAVSAARAAGTLFYLVAISWGAGLFAFRGLRYSLVPPLGMRAAPSDRAAVAAVLAIGMPAAVESLAFNGGKLLTQTYAAGLGATAVAADYLCSAAAGFIQVLLSSLLLAVPPLVGASLGRNRPDKARSVIALALFWGSVATTAMVVPGFLFAPSLLGLSTDDPSVLASATPLFRLFCFVTPFLWAPSFILPAGLRGAGDGRFTMMVAVSSMWTVRVGLGWLLAVPAGFGILGVWIAMISDWFVRAGFFVPRFRSGVWLSRSGLTLKRTDGGKGRSKAETARIEADRA